MCSQQSLRSACAYAQSDQSLCKSLEFSVSIKLLTEYNLEFLSLKGGCTGSSESTLVKMPHCLKSRVTAQLFPEFTLNTMYMTTWAWDYKRNSCSPHMSMNFGLVFKFLMPTIVNNLKFIMGTSGIVYYSEQENCLIIL